VTQLNHNQEIQDGAEISSLGTACVLKDRGSLNLTLYFSVHKANEL